MNTEQRIDAVLAKEAKYNCSLKMVGTQQERVMDLEGLSDERAAECQAYWDATQPKRGVTLADQILAYEPISKIEEPIVKCTHNLADIELRVIASLMSNREAPVLTIVKGRGSMTEATFNVVDFQRLVVSEEEFDRLCGDLQVFKNGERVK